LKSIDYNVPMTFILNNNNNNNNNNNKSSALTAVAVKQAVTLTRDIPTS